MRDESGFSFTELVVVSSVIILIGLFGYPTISAFKSNEINRSELRFTAGVLMKAKGEAIKRNCNVVVQFESKSCFIFVDNGRMSGVAKDNIWQPGEEVILRYHYRDDVCATTNFPADRIRFKSGYGLRPGTITLYANGTVCGKIVLNMVGRVRIEKS